jgi:hypothetical protein
MPTMLTPLHRMLILLLFLMLLVLPLSSKLVWTFPDFGARELRRNKLTFQYVGSDRTHN